MRTHLIPVSPWLVVAAAALYPGSPPAIGQQPESAHPPIVVYERTPLEPLADDVSGLRRQARALQRELERRDKDLARLQRDLEKAEREGAELVTAARELEARLRAAQNQEKDARTAARRQETALHQAMQEAELTRQALEAMEEEVKTHQTLATEAARETEILKDLLSRGTESAVPPVSSVSGPTSDLLLEAHQLLAEGQVEEAANRFRQGAARWPEDPAYPVGLASCHYAGGKFTLATPILERVLDDHADQADARGLLGLILWQEDDLRQAERNLSRAARSQPENERWQVYLGMVQYARGRHSSAQEAFERAIDINPMNPEAQFNLAILLAGEDQPDRIKARVHYEHARRLGTQPDLDLEKLLYPP